MVIFKICMVVEASKQYFYHRDHCSSAILRSDMDSLEHARASFNTLLWLSYINYIMTFFTASFTFKTSICIDHEEVSNTCMVGQPVTMLQAPRKALVFCRPKQQLARRECCPMNVGTTSCPLGA